MRVFEQTSKDFASSLLCLLLMVAGGCQCQTDSSDSGDSEVASSGRYGGSVGETLHAEDDLALMSPKQMSDHIYALLGQRSGHYWYYDESGQPREDQPGIFHDHVARLYAAELGGIDHVQRDERDPIPKVQTILLIRMLAERSATVAVDYAVNGESWIEGRDIFSIADPVSDRPYIAAYDQQADAEAEARWRQQLEEFYWSFFSRPITQQEYELLRTSFIEWTQMAEGYTPIAWMLLLYSLFSSIEFWAL